jgi:hypothetical protein
MDVGVLERLADLESHQGLIYFNHNTRSLWDSHLRGQLSPLDLMSVQSSRVIE